MLCTHLRLLYTSAPFRSPQRNIAVLTNISAMREWRREKGLEENAVGFVPTMGALHEGHIQLMRMSKQQCANTVASIFVNPSQFAAHEDLHKYPRQNEVDINMMEEAGVDAVFVPTVQEMYGNASMDPLGQDAGTFVQVRGLSEQLEGTVRPHFFSGVATVVTKLFNIVQPTDAFFGQKDGQQCAVIKRMVKDLHIPVRIHVMPTQRERDGLAMSSRNRYLTPEDRQRAPVLFKALSTALSQWLIKDGQHHTKHVIDIAKQIIHETDANIKIEYLSINDTDTLSVVKTIQPGQEIMFSGAIRLGSVRLIDNILYKA